MMRLASFSILVIALTPRVDASSPSVTVPCSPKARPVCDALSIEDPEERQAASWRVIREAFRSSDPDTRKDALKELSLRSWKMDLYPYLALIDEFGSSIDVKAAAQLGDEIEIKCGPRPVRIELLGQAIRSGNVKQRRGTERPRFVAAYWAATQGLSELREMVMEYVGTLPPHRRRRLNLDAVSSLFELCDGSEGGWDCPRVAAARLRDMTSEQLLDRLASDSGFYHAVTRLRASACEVVQAKVPCALFQSISLPPEAPEDAVNDVLGTPPVIRSIDPCTVPELANPTQGWIAARLQLLDASRPNPDGSGAFLSIAEGVTSHRPGDLIRFRIDVRDRAGNPPTDPITVRVEVAGSRAGWVSPPGKGGRCRSIQFLWNHPEAGEGVIPTFQEFDYWLGGQPEIAGLLPTQGADFKPVWRTADILRISLGRLRDYGEVVEHISDSTWNIRPEGDPVSSWTPMVDRLRAALSQSNTKALFLDAEITRPRNPVTIEPQRELIVMACRDNPTPHVLISSVRQDGTKLTDSVRVGLKNIGDSDICVGAFTLIPERAPVEGLTGPFVEVPLGSGHLEARSDSGEER
jgi:hypothetical protein